eukprot:jgi/Ulvmu1/10434/UM062_0030.1
MSGKMDAFVSSLCALLKYDHELLRQRGPAAWFVLLVAFPIHWITVTLLVVIFGWGTGWEPWYLLCIIPHSLNALFHSPLSLRYELEVLSASWIEIAWGEVFVHGGGYSLIVVSLIGLLIPAVDIPFHSVTLTWLGLVAVTPLMFLVDHVTNAAPTAIRGGSTPLSIMIFHAANGTRLIDPLADFILGFRLHQQARSGYCPWYTALDNGDSEVADHMHRPDICTRHHALAWSIMAASCLDFAILACYINILKGMLKRVTDYKKQIFTETVMLLCEVAILVCLVIITRHHAMDSSLIPEGADGDLQGYTILCSISTFTSLFTTSLMIVIPQSFWARLQNEPPMSLLGEVAAGLSLHAHRIMHRVSASVLPHRPRWSQPGQPTPHRSGVGALPQVPAAEGAGGGSKAEAVARPVGVAFTADMKDGETAV